MRISSGFRNFISLSSSFSTVMSRDYGEAVKTLNGFQSNAAVLAKVKKERDALRHENIPSMIKFCESAGITLDELDKLSVIHVSGTKGKGSTCAFCESILRKEGYKTGLYTSPHLMEVRERIRINGQPLSQSSFSNYFWEIHDRLLAKQGLVEEPMPAYFRFLTIMSFYVFLAEKVDVAIIEVGIGGQYDCTNVVRTPTVCGISSLGIDHVEILGDTISKIAWQKAGILKTGCPAVTVPQPEGGLDVLLERAIERQCLLQLIPDYDSYEWKSYPAQLGIKGSMQKVNASLAMQLSHTWMKLHKLPLNVRCKPVKHKSDSNRNVEVSTTFSVSSAMRRGLEECVWPGRNQEIARENVTYYLDGAHTKESITQCVEWFREASGAECKKYSGRVVKLLVFNFTGDRQPTELMGPLVDLRFDAVVFCPNVSVRMETSLDLIDHMTTITKDMERCQINEDLWTTFVKQSSLLATHAHTKIFPCVASSLLWCTQGCDSSLPELTYELPEVPSSLSEPMHIQILITGSLHLIGCALRILDPAMNN